MEEINQNSPTSLDFNTEKFEPKDDLNVSENFYKNGFYISTSMKLKMNDIKKICKIINDYTMKTN